MTTNTSIITALFPDARKARATYQAVRAMGYGDQDVNVIMSDATRARFFDTDAVDADAGSGPPPPVEGKGTDGMVGTTLGAAIGGALGTAVLPGAWTVLGAAAGGVLGSLIGYEQGDPVAARHREAIAEGAVLIGVRASSDAKGAVEDLFTKNGASIVNSTGAHEKTR